MSKHLLMAGCWIGLGLRAMAAPSGLALMPTADFVPDQEWVAEAQVDGSLESGTGDTRFINLQLGLTDRLEFGVDYDASDDTSEPWLGNAKLLAYRSGEGNALLALGFRNLGDEEKPEGYAVTTWTRGPVRGHVGGTYSEERDLDAVVGADYEWSPGWWGYVEWTSGKENAGSCGVNIPLPGPFDLMTGIIVPNSSADEVGYTVHLVCGGPWPGCGGKE